MTKRKAFTLMEIIIAMALMLIAVLSIFMLNQSSNKSSMDAYYEIMAFSLAREPIEVYRSFGYNQLSDVAKGTIPANINYKIGEFQPIVYNPSNELQYPADAENFQRRIDLEPGTSYNGTNYIKITVTVEVKGQSRAESWLSRNSVKLESIIMEPPK